MKTETAPKAVLLILMVLLGAQPGLRAANELSLSALIRLIRPSLVTVRVYDYSGRLKHLGSGFFVSSDGEFITNSHVLVPNHRAEVRLFNGTILPVERILSRDALHDLVRARIQPPDGEVSWLPLAERMPAPGESVVAAGSPLGLDQTFSEGIVSGIRRLQGIDGVLQISAPVSPGSSGGPVVDLKGRVVGIASFQISQGQNLNFAVPATYLQPSTARENREITITRDEKGTIILSD